MKTIFDVETFKKTCEKEANSFNVIRHIHPEDLIFQFCINNECFKTKNQAIKYYFSQGRDSAEKLAMIIENFSTVSFDKIELLEFASGYGAVTRHLRNVLPNVDITSCDIHEKAIEFIENQLFTPAILSHTEPECLQLPKNYDVVFVLSFFSHMPKITWDRWLLSLFNCVKRDGLLIFTTHGNLSKKHFGFPEIGEDGFWFKPTSEQTDLNINDYGMTISLEKYVDSAIKRLNNVNLIYYREGYWWEHQDLYVLRKL